MPLFRFHDSQGPPHGHLDRGTGRYAGLYGDSEPGDFLPPCFMDHGRKEISPLCNAFVEMTEGAGRLFCHLGREISPLRFASVEMTIGGPPTSSSRAGLRVGMGQMENALMIL